MHRPLTAKLVAALLIGATAPPLLAEKADRSKPMEVVSDGQQSASVDLKSKVTVISGNVVITQGTLQIKADRVEVRENPPGRYQARALGSTERPATFRQKRDRVDEVVEGEAERVEYDGATEKVRFVGNAKLRQVHPSGGPPDEANAAVITYDQRSDTIFFEGGAPTTAGAAPGRVRMVIIPRGAEVASEPAK